MARRLILVVLALAWGCQTGSTPASHQRATVFLEDGPVLVLPVPRTEGTMPLERVLATRRSQRRFSPAELDAATVSQMLWACQGITEPATGHRTAPSAGALYPLTIYWADHRGLFRYRPADHRLVTMTSDDVRPALALAALGQEPVRQASAILVLVGDPARLRAKYGERAGDFTAMEVGHAAQNGLLQATALGLAAVPVGGLSPAMVRAVLRQDDADLIYYLIPVGRPAL